MTTTIDVFDGVSEAMLRARGGNKWSKYSADVLPAWLADMDVLVAEPIRRALAETVAQSALGYARLEERQELFRAGSAWLAARHGWEPDPALFVLLSDVMQGVYVAIQTCTEPGDGIVVQGPIYPHFLEAIAATGRTVLHNDIIDPTGAALPDIEGLRRLAADPRARMLLLCNPHNPLGRAFTREELGAMGEIATEHDLTIVADEIWMDIVYAPHRHVPVQSLGPEIAARAISLTSATKTFNLGGMRSAVAILGSPALLDRFNALPPRTRGSVNRLGIQATITAWREAGPWLDALLPRLDANRRSVTRFIAERLPDVPQRLPEATFLTWLDFSALDLGRPAADFLLDRARVALNPGRDFGGYDACARLNFATTPAILTEICERLEKAIVAGGGR